MRYSHVPYSYAQHSNTSLSIEGGGNTCGVRGRTNSKVVSLCCSPQWVIQMNYQNKMNSVERNFIIDSETIMKQVAWNGRHLPHVSDVLKNIQSTKIIKSRNQSSVHNNITVSYTHLDVYKRQHAI